MSKLIRAVTSSRNFIVLSKYCSVISFSRSIHHLPSKEIDLKRVDKVRTFSHTCNAKRKHAPHIPVMAEEVLRYLEPSPGKIYVDMTFGAGGHSTKILESAENITIFALDRDPIAHEYAKEMAEKYPGQVIPLLGRFSELPQLLCKHKIKLHSIDGFLFDFGCSSMQFDIGERGFSLSKNGPLDMRMDGFRCPMEPTAAEVLEKISETQLVHILRCYGEEKRAKKIARAIIDARYSFRSLKSTHELAQLIESVLDEQHKSDAIGRFAHCATKTFQALRIFVNNELNEINYGIVLAGSYLKTSGRLITISFHSLEDTIVKRHISGNTSFNLANKIPLKYMSRGKYYSELEMEKMTKSPWLMLHKHVLLPTDTEVQENPRSRSAKFRATMKVE